MEESIPLLPPWNHTKWLQFGKNIFCTHQYAVGILITTATNCLALCTRHPSKQFTFVFCCCCLVLTAILQVGYYYCRPLQIRTRTGPLSACSWLNRKPPAEPGSWQTLNARLFAIWMGNEWLGCFLHNSHSHCVLSVAGEWVPLEPLLSQLQGAPFTLCSVYC